MENLTIKKTGCAYKAELKYRNGEMRSKSMEPFPIALYKVIAQPHISSYVTEKNTTAVRFRDIQTYFVK